MSALGNFTPKIPLCGGIFGGGWYGAWTLDPGGYPQRIEPLKFPEDFH